jgi:hypothetical protein
VIRGFWGDEKLRAGNNITPKSIDRLILFKFFMSFYQSNIED